MEASTRIVLEYTGITSKPNGIVKIIHVSKSMFRKSFSRMDLILQSELAEQAIQDLDNKSVKSINWFDIEDIGQIKLLDEDIAIFEQYKDSRAKNNICSINLLDSKVV